MKTAPSHPHSSAKSARSFGTIGLWIAVGVIIVLSCWLWQVTVTASPVSISKPDEVEVKISPTPLPEPSATPTPAKPTAAPPKPTRMPTTSNTDSSALTVGEQKNCASLKNSGASTITITLQPRSGNMTGDTVVRLKQGGNCPGSSTSEQWLAASERQKTFNNVAAGTYLIELANGNYDGVIRKVVTVEGGRQYVFTVPIND